MVASFATIKSSAYYTRKGQALSYYVDTEAAGLWLRGHDTLGVAAGNAVTAEAFDRVCAGLDATGKPLVKTNGARRMLGVDITLSAPKSFSVLYAVADPALRALLAEAEQIAIGDAIKLIEMEIPLARRGRNGSLQEHAKFVAAIFTHSEARPERHADGVIFADPQRHHHVCIPNIAQRPDGTWGGANSVQIRQNRNALGSVFRLALASALQARGFAIEQADNEWKWSIVGVPEKLTRYFSARRVSLEEELADAGVTSGQAPALAAAINETDRRAKQDLNLEQLTAQWHEAVARLGYKPEQIVLDSLEAGRGQERTPPDPVALRKRKLVAVPVKLTEFQATFARRQLIETSANSLVGTGAYLEELLAGAKELVASNAVLERAQTREGSIYTTPEMLAAEQALVDLVQRNAKARLPGPSRDILDSLLANTDLNVEQQKVVRAATSGSRFTLVQGGAGTGKSSTLRTIAQAWQSAGYEIAGTALAWQATNVLADDLGVKSRAIDAWVKAIDAGHQPFGKKTCLIIEEAGLLSTQQALRLLHAVDQTGGVVIMVGDIHQLLPIGAGHGMRLIHEAVGATRIDTVVRQKEGWARQAPQDFARGKAEKALKAFAERGRILSHDGARATVEALADRWNELASADPSRNVLVTAKTNAEVRALSAAIRNRLRERRALTGPDITVEAADSSGNRHGLRLAVGDQIRFLRRQDELGVINGTEARITAISQSRSGRIKITAERDGRRLAFSPADVSDNKGRVRLAHAYAQTLFAAQGRTVDQALVLISGRFDRHDAYVASSRARETTELFLDSRTLDREIEQQEPLPSEADRNAARMAYLATRLARQSIKTNAIDYLPEQERARDSGRELGHEL